jgi:hypothetical protein
MHFTLNGQNNLPILERKITVKIVNQSMDKALNILAETAKFNFSYSSQIIKTTKIVSVYADNRTIKDILDQLFNSDITYQQIGNHLVLQKKIQSKQTSRIQSDKALNRYDYTISGYIRNVASGDGIKNVSVYNKASLANTLSGDFGYYKIYFSSKSSTVDLVVRKENFKDTTIQINFANNGVIESFINIETISSPALPRIEEPKHEGIVIVSDSNIFAPIDSSKTTVIDSSITTKKSNLMWFDTLNQIKIEDTKLGQWLLGTYNSVISKNIRDSFQRDWQITFIPPFGTNGSLSGLVTNRVSFNTLIGYNGGLDGVEFGGIFIIFATVFYSICRI